MCCQVPILIFYCFCGDQWAIIAHSKRSTRLGASFPDNRNWTCFLNVMLPYKIRLCTNSQKRRLCQLTSVCSVLPFVYQWWYGDACLCVAHWGPVQSDAVWLGPVWHFILEYNLSTKFKGKPHLVFE